MGTLTLGIGRGMPGYVESQDNQPVQPEDFTPFAWPRSGLGLVPEDDAEPKLSHILPNMLFVPSSTCRATYGITGRRDGIPKALTVGLNLMSRPVSRNVLSPGIRSRGPGEPRCFASLSRLLGMHHPGRQSDRLSTAAWGRSFFFPLNLLPIGVRDRHREGSQS
jgi:hypothetical protein